MRGSDISAQRIKQKQKPRQIIVIRIERGSVLCGKIILPQERMPQALSTGCLAPSVVWQTPVASPGNWGDQEVPLHIANYPLVG